MRKTYIFLQLRTYICYGTYVASLRENAHWAGCQLKYTPLSLGFISRYEGVIHGLYCSTVHMIRAGHSLPFTVFAIPLCRYRYLNASFRYHYSATFLDFAMRYSRFAIATLLISVAGPRIILMEL
jgi:hypothetical protein